MPKVLMVLGPPGSGKGTQVKMLADQLGFHHFISSKIGRDYINMHNDPESLKQKERYEKGLLFETEWMFERVKEKLIEALNHKDKCRGVIFDGSPRTLYEAENLFNFISEKIGKENIIIIEIKVPEEELRKRIKKRLVLEKRIDDKEEIFNKRMEVYKKETIPALDFLKKNHKIYEIDGEQSIEQVHEEIMEKLSL